MHDPTTPLLRTEALSVGYQGRPLLEDITLSVRAGEILTLIGPNGGGKSTLLKSLTRQLQTISGTVYLGKDPLAQLTELQSARRLSLMMTNRVQPELMTCEEVVSTGRYPYTGLLGILSPHDWQRVREAMEQVHCSDLRHRDFTRISDGQRQRVMLARAICQEPEVLVLDEPTSFLDIRHKLELLSLLKVLAREQQIAVVLSLHELDLAQKVSDRVLCIGTNGADRLGTPEEIFTEDYIRQLYGVTEGSYHPLFGSLELSRPKGEPKVFVIGGGGAGIEVYRTLQRRGIPFAAGVIHENDLDYPVASALASCVVTERGFEPIRASTLEQARAVMEGCDRVLCPLTHFGAMNKANETLRTLAASLGKLTDLDHLSN